MCMCIFAPVCMYVFALHMPPRMHLNDSSVKTITFSCEWTCMCMYMHVHVHVHLYVQMNSNVVRVVELRCLGNVRLDQQLLYF